MSSKIKSIQNKIYLYEYLIFFVGICLCLMFLGGNYVKNTKQRQRETIDKVTKKYGDFLKQFEYLPQNIAESPYIVFVIDAAKDDYIIERYSKAAIDDLLWDQYSTKLIYQMQKQRQGWTAYPLKKPWHFFAENKVIRFLSLDELGWIIALEATQPSEWALITQVLSVKSIFQVIVLLLLGFFIIRITTLNFTKNFKAVVLDSIEKNYFNYDKDGATKGRSAPVKGKKEKFKGLSQTLDTISSSLAKYDNKNEEKDIIVKPEKSPVETKPKEIVIEKKFQAPPAEKIITPPKEAAPIQAAPEPKVPQEEPLDDMSIELKKIQSPVLKKLIKEMRDE